MRVAYADPPYIGCAHLYPEKQEVDHAALIARLELEFPDGWALSSHVPGLKIILPLCPDDVRVGAWVKPFSSSRPNVNPVYAWEPVIWRGGRKGKENLQQVRDWVSTNPDVGRRTGALIGKKPESFCWWLFLIMGLQPGDELVDLFPGSGAVTAAWRKWQRQLWTVTA